MTNSLKIIRERKKLSVPQLAAKASIPAHLLTEYDEGRKTIPLTHLRMLAKALWVTPEEIEAAPPPPPPPEPRRPSPPAVEPGLVAEPARRLTAAGSAPLSASGVGPQVMDRPASTGARLAAPTPRMRPSAPPAQITDGQVNEIVRLSAILGETAEEVAERLGKTLEELSRVEARQCIGLLRREIADAGLSLKGAKSIREAPDFEPRYLEEQLRDGATLAFTMFDGQKLSGVICGFDSYTITVKDPQTGAETVLRKLAMMYYQRAKGNG